MSGSATTAILASIVALGAAVGISFESDDDVEYVSPLLVTHRGPPGPAQIELRTATESSTSDVQPPEEAPLTGLFGVDVASAITDDCAGSESLQEPVSIEQFVCHLAADPSPAVSRVDLDFARLWLGEG